VKWYNYLACFFAGVFLIHIVPHLLHGMSLTNIIGVLVSLAGGCLLLWRANFHCETSRPLFCSSWGWLRY
jgi:hypothetical protein